MLKTSSISLETPLPWPRDVIAALIPHQGRMCLLDQLVAFTPTHIECVARGHRDLDHPLRSPSGLLSVVGVEYAGQAMALHGALLAVGASEAQSAQGGGYLASVRGLTCYVEKLNTVLAPLRVRAQRLAGDAHQVLYSFDVSDMDSDQCLLQGRAAVVLHTGLPS